MDGMEIPPVPPSTSDKMTYEKDKDVLGTVEYLIGEVDIVRSI